MKRTVILCLVLALMIAAIVPVAAFAVSNRGNFTDADSDGVCDYAANGSCAYVDENNDGSCDNRVGCGRGNGRGCGRGMQANGCPRWNGQ